MEEKKQEQEKQNTETDENIPNSSLLGSMKRGSVPRSLVRFDEVGDDDSDLHSSVDESVQGDASAVHNSSLNGDLSGFKRKGGLRVQFDDDLNSVKTITPRSDSFSVGSVQSRALRSQVRPHTGVASSRLRYQQDQGGNNESHSGILHQPIERRIERPWKPQTTKAAEMDVGKQRAYVATASVSYLEDDNCADNNKSTRTRRKPTKQGVDVKTVISQISLSDSDSDTGITDKKSSMPMKILSSKASQNSFVTIGDQSKPKTFTTKTLELGDGLVTEKKNVFMLHTQRPPHHNQRTYVVPTEFRPKPAAAAAKDERLAQKPTTSQKPEPKPEQVSSVWLV